MYIVKAVKQIIKKILKTIRLYDTYLVLKEKCKLANYYFSHKFQHRARKNRYRNLLNKKVNIKSNDSACLNVLIVTVDCLRADHLPAYGYHRQTAPFLQSTLESCAMFTNAVSAASWTYPSLTSILTGLYPFNHGADFSEDLRCWSSKNTPNLPFEGVFSIGEVLSLFGYKTMVASAISIVRLPIANMFDDYFRMDKKPAVEVVDLFSRWIKRKKRIKPFFAHLHLGDLHAPIYSPDRHKNTFGYIPKLDNLERWNHYYCTAGGVNKPGFELYKNSRIKLYDSALKFVDEQIASLFSFLKKEKLLESTLIFITADHGEEFWDHFETERDSFHDPRGLYGAGHGHSVFQEIIHVPLLIYGPKVQKGLFTHYVSSVDIVPTILDILDIKHSLKFDGRNIFEVDKEKMVVSGSVEFGYEKKAVIADGFKLIQSLGDKVEFFYDLHKDPLEKNNLNSHADIKVKLKEKLVPFWKQGEGEKMIMTKAIEDQLRSLGYL